MASITIVPSSYTGLSNISTTQTSYPLSNGYTDTSSTTYARFQTSTSGQYTGIIYYCFDTSEIPSGAIITSVTMKAKWSVSSTSNITAVSVQPATGTTLKGSANTTRSTTATVYTLTAGTWTRGELDDARVYVTFTRSSGGGSRYMYFYGAELTVEYELSDPVTVTSSLVGDGTINPSGATTTYEGVEYSITITPDNTSDTVSITNNGTDVTNDLVAHYAGGTDNRVLGTYTLTSGSFNGSGATYFSGLVGKGVDNTQTTSNYYSSSSSTQAVFTYDMSFDLPSNATIERVYCEVNGHAESTSNSNEYMCVQLKSGSTALSEQLNFKSVGTSNSTQTLEATTLPTVSQLSSMVLECTLGYYGGAINGATCFVVYSTGTTDPEYYTYTYTVDGDATIVVTIGGGGGSSPKIYLKINGSWTEYSKIYLKVNGSWVEQSSSNWSSLFDTSTNYRLKE